MSDITLEEWKIVVANLNRPQGMFEARYRINSNGAPSVTIGSGMLPVGSVSVELRSDSEHDRGCVVPRASVVSATAPLGDMIRATAHHDAFGELLRIGRMWSSEIAGISVWFEGTCPCGSCSGTGKSYGDACKRCNGEGVR